MTAQPQCDIIIADTNSIKAALAKGVGRGVEADTDNLQSHSTDGNPRVYRY
jgi:hypothetical protein